MLANLAVKEMEGEDIASFSPPAGATGPDLSGQLGLQVRVWRLTEQAAGVPEIGGCGACMTTVVGYFQLMTEAGSFFSYKSINLQIIQPHKSLLLARSNTVFRKLLQGLARSDRWQRSDVPFLVISLIFST
jgi:hypothetical protein